MLSSMRRVTLGLLLLLVSSYAGALQVFWASDPVAPGDAVLVTGDGFGSQPGLSIVRLPDGAGHDDAAGAIQVAPIQVSAASIKFIVPKELNQGVYRVTLKTADATTNFFLNKPQVYWAQGDQGDMATPAGWIRVFGRNVGRSASTMLRLLPQDDPSAKTIEIKAQTYNLWSANFSLNDTLPEGRYRLQLYNGQGDSFAWQDAGYIAIKSVPVWPSKNFNVKNYGAEADGRDVTDAVEAALKAASDNHGGVVYFPRGRYLLSRMVHIPKYVILKGEGSGLTSLMWTDFADPPDALLRGSNHFAIEEMTLYASNYRDVIESDTATTEDGEPGNIRIRNVVVRAVLYRGHLKPAQIDDLFKKFLSLSSGGGDTLHLGGKNIVIEGGDFYGSGRSLYLSHPIGVRVVNNKFYNGRWGWYCITGSDGVIFEHNQIIGGDLMATGGGINTLGSSFSRNVYFADNDLSQMHGLDREAITTDGPGGYYFGKVRAASPKRIELLEQVNGDAQKWFGAGLYVLGGKGQGEYAQIDSINNREVKLIEPLMVAPDETSVVSIVPLQKNYLFISNRITDAGLAIQFYGSSTNFVAAGNVTTRSGGFIATGLWYRGGYQPSWYCQFLGNQIIDGNVYRGGSNNAINTGKASIGIIGLPRPPNTSPLAFAQILRGNRLDANAYIDINGSNDSTVIGVQDVIVQGNVIPNLDKDIYVSKGVAGLLSMENQVLQ